MPIKIDVINETTKVSDQQIKWLMAALQKQIIRDFEPIWGYTATLVFVSKGVAPSLATHWQLVFMDDSDQAGALGYHDLTSSGLPLGKVFVETTVQAGCSWSVSASHEVLEMLADPYANETTLLLETNSKGTAYAYEVCDACEVDDQGYVINNFKVSDFVTPDWFNPSTLRPNTKYDFMGHITKPLELLPGGYIAVYDIPNHRGWDQINNGRRDPNKDRFNLRKLSDTQRMCSTRHNDLWKLSNVALPPKKDTKEK